MAIVIGVNPGGRNAFATAALYWNKRLPASLINVESFSCVDEAMTRIIGVVGEWGELAAVAVDAPLTWSGSLNGVRPCDVLVKKRVPAWAPRTWHKSPTSLSGNIAMQGPALAWSLAHEIKTGALPQHTLIETNPKVSLALALAGLKESVLGYSASKSSAASKLEHVEQLVTHFVDAGILKLEVAGPRTGDGLEALVCALVALAVTAPEAGLVTQELAGGDIRPLGARKVVLLEALP